MSEEKVLNIYQKLQRCRVEVQDEGVKKSGKNAYSNYEYFELKDFLPEINKSMDKNQLTSVFNFSKEKAILTIVNSQDPNETIIFETPVAITPLKGCNEMQCIGAAQSYARRYLYFMAFEIAEQDALDSRDIEVDKEKELARKKIGLNKIDTIKSMLKKSNSDEKLFLDYYKVKSIKDMTNEIFFKAMKTLQEKLDKIEKEQNQLNIGI